jgi:nitrilase
MTEAKTDKGSVRVAAVQAEGRYFDLEAAVSKTCKLVKEAADKGCDMVASPEVWIPHYPGWISYVKIPMIS